MNFIFDIDGTISNNGRNLDINNEKAIFKILENGHNVIFASARPVRDILPLLNPTFHKCLMIGCNGGICYENGEFCKTYHFEKSQIKAIVDFLDMKNIPYVLDGDWYYSFSKAKHPFQDYIRSLGKYEMQNSQLIDMGITKLLLLNNSVKAELITFLEKNNVIYSLNNHTKDNLFDITPNKNNKYIALKESCIDMDSSICFGNDENDFQMLENAKHSIFVSGENTFDKATMNIPFEKVHKVIESFLKN